MKKRLLIIVTALVIVLTCAFAFVACGGGDNVEGTYYLYMNGQKYEGASVEIKDGKVTYKQTGEDGVSTINGTYSMDGKNVKVTMTEEGETETMVLTYVSDGVYKVEEGNYAVYYCKDGKTPPADATGAE